jgi:CRP/FNR family transcriptional regulator, cyclic AMP receptor protein
MAKDSSDLLQWLPSIALFGGLEPNTLNRVIGMLGVHECKPEFEVCRQGDVGRTMFIVREGEVMVSRNAEDTPGKRVKMIRLGAGEFFGEMTLIDIQKRSANVVVTKPSLLYSLSNKDLFALYQADVPGYVMVLQNLCRELSRRLRVTNARLGTMAREIHDTEATLIRPAIKRK